MCRSLDNRALGYRIKVIHTTPNTYPQYFEPDCYHIGRVFWETDKLPLDFAKEVEKCDEVWTGSQYNLEAIRNAGVTVPVYIIPEAIDTELDIHGVEPYHTEATGYKFYSIFEFTTRKNYEALLTAYWQEFQSGENVSLTLKTYLDNFTPKKKAEIDMRIHAIKKRLNQSVYAPIYMYRKLMDRQQVYRFHKTFDCFVSAHRGEGWGIPQMEALLLGKPVISTNCGGIHEYLTPKKDAMLVPYKAVQVAGDVRNANWYRSDQNWAEIDITELRKAMRWAYENQEKAHTMGLSGRDTVIQKLSMPVVGQLMKQRLQNIIENNYGKGTE